MVKCFFTMVILLVMTLSISILAFAQDVLSAQRQLELKGLLLQDCGSCHGMTLKGGLGPALTPAALKTKSRKMIEVTIANGRPGTPMPPWNKILNSAEINWMVETLYAGVKQE